MDTNVKKEHIREQILERAFIKCDEVEEVTLTPWGTKPSWFFDFRTLLFDKEFMTEICNSFWKQIGKEQKIQIGGLESAAIPLVSSLVMTGKNATGFYIRKSRKKKMQMKQIEGTLTEHPIVLVDDLINSGSSFRKQITILEQEGKKVSKIFTILRFRELDEYKYFTDKGIEIISLFSIKDFDLTYKDPHIHEEIFIPNWYFKPKRSHVFKVTNTATPLTLDNKLFHATDDGYVRCFEKKSGDLMWQKKLFWRTDPAFHTFSQLHIKDHALNIGSYNGKFFRLSAKNGKVEEVLSLTEEVSAVHAISENHILLAGKTQLPKKGEIILFDLEEEQFLWKHTSQAAVNALTVIEDADLAIYGDDEGGVNALDLKKGTGVWEFHANNSIKSSGLVYNDTVLFSSYDGIVYQLKYKNGAIVKKFATEGMLHATPAIVNQKVYLSSLDGFIFCFNLETGEKLWEYETRGRIFSSPVIHNNVLYIGNNEGRLYKLDAESGKLLGSRFFTERITSRVLVDDSTIYVTTLGGELYSLGEI